MKSIVNIIYLTSFFGFIILFNTFAQTKSIYLGVFALILINVVQYLEMVNKR